MKTVWRGWRLNSQQPNSTLCCRWNRCITAELQENLLICQAVKKLKLEVATHSSLRRPVNLPSSAWGMKPGNKFSRIWIKQDFLLHGDIDPGDSQHTAS